MFLIFSIYKKFDKITIFFKFLLQKFYFFNLVKATPFKLYKAVLNLLFHYSKKGL
jgi:hypothetical protein